MKKRDRERGALEKECKTVQTRTKVNTVKAYLLLGADSYRLVNKFHKASGSNIAILSNISHDNKSTPSIFKEAGKRLEYASSYSSTISTIKKLNNIKLENKTAVVSDPAMIKLKS